MPHSHLDRLYAHNAWADERAIAALQRAQDAGTPVDRALTLLNHVVGAEEVWLARLEGRTPDAPVWPSLTLEQCASLARRTHERLQRFVASLDDTTAARSVHYRNSAGAEFDSTIDDILLHAALHGAYHRGQVALLLRDGGAEPNPTDYIAFVRGSPAATRTS